MELRSTFPAKWTIPFLLLHLAENETRFCFSGRASKQLQAELSYLLKQQDCDICFQKTEIRELHIKDMS